MNAMDNGINSDNVFEMLKDIVTKMSQYSNDLDKTYIGKVIEYDTTNKTKRLQIKVYGVYDDVPDSDLPWAEPIGNTLSGESFILPEKNSLVNVVFDHNDIYRPMYSTKLNVDKDIYSGSTSTKSKMFTSATADDFGNIMVLFENDNLVVSMNRKTGDFVFKTSDGNVLNINSSNAKHDDMDSNELKSSFNVAVGNNTKYSLSINENYLIINDGNSENTYAYTGGSGIVAINADKATIIGTDNNGEVYDKTSTLRYSSPGQAVPDMANKGPYCALPVCPASGAPHCGNILATTGAVNNTYSSVYSNEVRPITKNEF
jgi:hypothetical protein